LVIAVIMALAIVITNISIRKMVGWLALIVSICFFAVQANPDLPSKVPVFMKRMSVKSQRHVYPLATSVFTRLIPNRIADDG